MHNAHYVCVACCDICACACVYLCLLHVQWCILIHITCEPQGSDITYVENNKQHCKHAMCWPRRKPQMCGNPKPSALCWTTKGTPPRCANPNHQHETCWALCHLTSSTWMELLTINIHEVQCPKIFVHEGFGHVHIICGVQTRLSKSLAHSHVGFLHHCVAPPWIETHCFFSKVVQVVESGGGVPCIQTLVVWMIGSQWPHVMDPCYSLSKVNCWLYW